MLENLTTFIQLLSRTELAWQEFQKVDIGYFAFEDDREADLYLQSIAKAYSELRQRLATLKALKVKLVDSNHVVGCNFYYSCCSATNEYPAYSQWARLGASLAFILLKHQRELRL